MNDIHPQARPPAAAAGCKELIEDTAVFHFCQSPSVIFINHENLITLFPTGNSDSTGFLPPETVSNGVENQVVQYLGNGTGIGVYHDNALRHSRNPVLSGLELVLEAQEYVFQLGTEFKFPAFVHLLIHRHLLEAAEYLRRMIEIDLNDSRGFI